MKLFTDQFIVVTGGAGFIGSAVIKRLNELGYENIIVIDDLDMGDKWKNLVGKKFFSIIPSARTFEWLEGRESEIEAFIHLGACSSTVETDASFLLENNTAFSQRLAEYALDHGHRFVYASSAATYGDGSLGFCDDENALDELRPLNMYGYSKHLFDQWLKRTGVLNKVAGLKYFNVYGPNEYHKGRMASAVFHFTKQIMEIGKIQLFRSSEPDKYTDGGQMRDFIYIKDAARITCDILLQDIFGIFNLGTGIPHTWNELGSAVFEGVGKKTNIKYIEMPSDLKGKYQNYTCADMGKLKKALGEKVTFTPFKECVVSYVRDYIVPQKTW